MLHVICCGAANAIGPDSRGRSALCRQSTAVTIIMTAGVNAVAADAEAATCNMHGADDCLCVRVWGKLLGCLSPHIVAHCAAVHTASPSPRVHFPSLRTPWDSEAISLTP